MGQVRDGGGWSLSLWMGSLALAYQKDLGEMGTYSGTSTLATGCPHGPADAMCS